MDWWCSNASLLLYILSHLEQVCTSIQSSELSAGIQALLCTCACEGPPPDLLLWAPLLSLSVLVGEFELWASAIAATKCPSLPFNFADEARDCSTDEFADTAPESAHVFKLLLCPFPTHWLLQFIFSLLALDALWTFRWCSLLDQGPPVLCTAAVCGCGWCSMSCWEDCWAICCSSCNCDKNDFLQRGVACLTYTQESHNGVNINTNLHIVLVLTQ